MADTQPPRVDNEIVQMWRKDGRLYAIAGFIAGVMLFPLLASLGGDNLTSFLQELAPEAIGILVTVFLIDRIIQRRDEKNAEEALKRQLVMDAGSVSNEFAKNAVHQLWRRGWLRTNDGLLKGADLTSASLQEAVLMDANLQRADLTTANLQEANLRGADLRGARFYGATLRNAQLDWSNLQDTDMRCANLIDANLERADLQRANLENAFLLSAKLERANLQNANLKHADLRRVNLMGANLEGVELVTVNLEEAMLIFPELRKAKLRPVPFDEETLLPDATQWTPETDMSRFTDPNHPDFWRSDNPDSPAYQGKSET